MNMPDASRFASRPETRVRMERRSAITAALKVIRDHRDLAHATALLLDSVHLQARWDSVRDTVGIFKVSA